MAERIDHTTPQPTPTLPGIAAIEPLGDLVSGDALHTNSAAAHVRAWMTVSVATAVTAGADARAHASAVTR